MCGINGYTGENKHGAIERMNVATKHRGPDGVGVFSDEHLTLGQNLLAITETPIKAKQPYQSHDGNFVLVYNGEIYNYRALRTLLTKEGETFHTDGDTEVLFAGLMRHGQKFLEKLDGMFAIALYDRRKQTLLLARDRAGMKPLYVAHDGGRTIFSSELRGLFAYGFPRVLDKETLRLFFAFGYTPKKETLIQGVKKVLPGQSLTIHLDTQEVDESWIATGARTEVPCAHSGEDIRERFGASVAAHTMGLRPYGLFLSGGVDSTVILHELASRQKENIRTYTTRFDTRDARYNEDADLAKRLTGDYHIAHHELLVTERMYMDAYESAIEAMEEPRYNASVPAYWLLAQMAAKDITVVLNGSGGDELFLGYPRYLHAQSILAKYRTYPASLCDAFYSLKASQEGHLAFGRQLALRDPLTLFAYVNKLTPLQSPALRFMRGFDLRDVTLALRASDAPAIRHPLKDSVNAVAEYDRHFWLANEEFMRTDKIIMHFGMEGRFPFLANDLLSFANSIPSEEKLRGGKKSLVRAAYRGKLPDYILDKRKSGWNAPVAEWMSGAFGNMVAEILSPDYYPPTADLFDFHALRKHAFDGKKEFSKADLAEFLPIVQFQVWAKIFAIQLS
jgi:asparagine synthase (glutamine-hydrolysing)